MYVSVTGLKVLSWVHFPEFWLHALRTFTQAKAAPGNIRAEVRQIGGYQHTLSVWTDRAATRAYVTSGAHLKAVKRFRIIATGRIIGWDSQHMPDWGEALAVWREKARDY